jgi:hypothetical protein
MHPTQAVALTVAPTIAVCCNKYSLSLVSCCNPLQHQLHSSESRSKAGTCKRLAAASLRGNEIHSPTAAHAAAVHYMSQALAGMPKCKCLTSSTCWQVHALCCVLCNSATLCACVCCRSLLLLIACSSSRQHSVHGTTLLPKRLLPQTQSVH